MGTNPWLSADLWEEFLFYCCPECDVRLQVKNEFMKHALSNHPWVSWSQIEWGGL